GLRTEELVVQLAHLLDVERLDHFELLFDGRLVARIVLGVRVDNVIGRAERQGLRIGQRFLQCCNLLALQDLEFLGRQGRFPQDLPYEIQNVRQEFTLRLNGKGDRTAAN